MVLVTPVGMNSKNKKLLILNVLKIKLQNAINYNNLGNSFSKNRKIMLWKINFKKKCTNYLDTLKLWKIIRMIKIYCKENKLSKY